jgi:hypothetical protein
MRTWANGSIVTRILCAVALVMLGFSGNALADPTSDPFSAQYQLPDGSYSSLCQPGDEKGGGSHHGADHCDSCVMAAGHLFTPPEAAPAVLRVLAQGETIAAAANVNLKPIVSHHRQSRGPPLSA